MVAALFCDQNSTTTKSIRLSADPLQSRIMAAYLIGAAAMAAAGAASYQSMAPTAQWYGRTFTGAPRASKQIALTYDDGPNDPWTLRLLEVLAKHGAPATFFMIGRYARQRPEIAREIAQAGHVIGNHTHSHPALVFEREARIRTQLAECDAALTDAIGPHSNLFRPPFGARRPAVLRIAREMGLQPVMWNITGYDWNATSAESIERKVSPRIRGGDVILLHDGGHLELGADRSRTVAATENLICRYQSKGYKFVTIPEMMEGSHSERSLPASLPAQS